MKSKKNARILPSVMLLGPLVLVGACNSIANDAKDTIDAHDALVRTDGNACKPNDKVVKLIFDDNGCPLRARPDKFEITGREKFVCWESVDKAGQPKFYNYELYFEPFKNRPFEPGGKGVFRKKIDATAPITESGVDYKYTVDGRDCPGGDDERYYDPRFTVRR